MHVMVHVDISAGPIRRGEFCPKGSDFHVNIEKGGEKKKRKGKKEGKIKRNVLA